MLSGVLCCHINSPVDEGNRLQTVESHLTAAISDITPGQVGSQTQPETTYANQGGWSLLRSLDEMRSGMEDLRSEVKSLQKKVCV